MRSRARAAIHVEVTALYDMSSYAATTCAWYISIENDRCLLEQGNNVDVSNHGNSRGRLLQNNMHFTFRSCTIDVQC